MLALFLCFFGIFPFWNFGPDPDPETMPVHVQKQRGFFFYEEKSMVLTWSRRWGSIEPVCEGNFAGRVRIGVYKSIYTDTDWYNIEQKICFAWRKPLLWIILNERREEVSSRAPCWFCSQEVTIDKLLQEKKKHEQN